MDIFLCFVVYLKDIFPLAVSKWIMKARLLLQEMLLKGVLNNVISMFVVWNQNRCKTEHIYICFCALKFALMRFTAESHNIPGVCTFPRRPFWLDCRRLNQVLPVPAHLRSLNVWVCRLKQQQDNVMLIFPPRPSLALPSVRRESCLYYSLNLRGQIKIT